MTIYLEEIALRFPGTDAGFTGGLASLIGVLGKQEDRVLELTRSSPSFYPQVLVELQSGRPGILTDFRLSNGETISFQVENSTGLGKANRHAYRPLSVETVKHRLMASGVRLVGVDHTGFNLPWFSSGLHPRIVQLWEALSARCLYHRYPTGEPWDFILPGDLDEIAARKAVDVAA